jgi:hypothetical protein
MKTNSSDSKREVSNLKASFKKWADKIFHLDSHEITAERRNFFFRKNRFSSIKSIKNFFLDITESVFYINVHRK